MAVAVHRSLQARIVDAVTSLLYSGSERDRRGAVIALSRIGLPLVETVLRVCRELYRCETVARTPEAVDVLAEIGSPAVPGLLDLMQDPHSGVRTSAIKALGQIHDPQAALALVDALDSSREVDMAVRAFAALALRDWIASNGGRAHEPWVFTGLLSGLNDPQSGVRAHIVTALAELGVSQALDGLLRALSDSSGLVRAGAAEALGLLRDARSEEGLQRASEDQDEDVRAAATPALRSLADDQQPQEASGSQSVPTQGTRFRAGAAEDPNPIGHSDGLLRWWADPPWDVETRFSVYEFLSLSGPQVRAVAAPDSWLEWRDRLSIPTRWSLAVGLQRCPARAREAESIYKTILDRSPECYPGLEDYGSLLAAWPGRQGQALELFEQCVRTYPRAPRAWIGLGLTLHRLGRSEAALAASHEAANVEPTTGETDWQSVVLCFDASVVLGRMEEAESFLKAAEASLGSDSPLYLVLAAQLDIAHGNVDQAIARCENASRRYKAPLDSHFTLGLAYLCAQREAEAGRAYGFAIRQATNWVELEDACTTLEGRLGDGSPPGAIECLERLRSRRDELAAEWPEAG